VCLLGKCSNACFNFLRAGTTIAVSSPDNDDNGSNKGKVQVYKYSEVNQSWVQQGTGIGGECRNDRIGEGSGAIALDRNGTHLAVGAPRGANYYGMLRVYEALEGAGDGSNGSTNSCD